MEPLHRISLIPDIPSPSTPWWKKFLRSFRVMAFALVALIVGIGFSEGIISFLSKGGETVHTLFYNKPTLDVVVSTTTDVEKGSDEKVAILPINKYNVSRKVSGVNADAYIVGDIDTGEVIAVKNADEVYPIASISKIITALVAMDHFTSHQQVTVTKSALATYGPSGGLTVGEKVKALDLLYPLLLESSNDVALLISEQFEQGAFSKLMNEKVQLLGMTNTFFEEASGLSPKNVSTVSDLFRLTEYIYSEEPHILDITRIREFSLMNHTWNNYNYFLKEKTFLGGKNGFTDEALRTAVNVFNLPIRKGRETEEHPIAIIVLHTETREKDITALLDFLKKSVSLGE
jgi:D-alanyl-D-alanine carboxypeptidase